MKLAYCFVAHPDTATVSQTGSLLYRRLATCLVMALLLTGCVSGRYRTGTQQEVRAILDKQVAEWNAGNLAGFMETYARSPDIRFASGGDLSLGWQTVFDRYRRKYGGDQTTMGQLKFSDIDIQMLGSDTAFAFGRWHLTREAGNATGLYTLVLRKLPVGWRIVHDHTSVASP